MNATGCTEILSGRGWPDFMTKTERGAMNTNGNKNYKLAQVLAIEKGIKERVGKTVTEVHQAAQKPSLFSGFVKRYRRINEAGEVYPDQRAKVQMSAEQSLRTVIDSKAELLNVTAQKDYANLEATADIVVDGQVVVVAAPATFILWLEKQIEDIRTFVSKLPVLDEAEDWELDAATNTFKSGEVSTHRTQKIAEPIVLYPATDKHPAQTQLITRDVLVGYWDEVKLSGALPVPRKAAILARIEKLYRAVKVAREAANMAEAPRRDVGGALLNSLLE